MNCETCQNDFLDLLYDELEARRADEVRAHVATCTDCKQSFEKLGVARRLARMLPIETPPSSIDAVILAAARAKVEGDASALRKNAPVEDDGGLWAVIVRWANSFVMGPQVAMATIMVLVIAIGVWYFPSQRDEPETGGRTVVNPDHGGEAGPIATLEPAEPLDLTLDPHAGRIRARDGLAPPAELVPADEPALAEEQRAHERGGGVVEGNLAPADPAPAVQGEQLARLDDGARDGRAAPMLPMRSRVARNTTGVESDRDAEEAAAGGDSLPVVPGRSQVNLEPERRRMASPPRTEAETSQAQSGYRHAEPAAPPPQYSPAPRSESSGASSAGPSTTIASSRAPSQPSGAGAARPTMQATQPGTAGGSRQLYERATQSYQQGRYAAAADDFQSVVVDGTAPPELVQSALHQMARSYARANQCQMAVSHYESLLRRFPRYGGRGRALMELGDCYVRSGQLSQAERVFQQASSLPSVASDARRELARTRQRVRGGVVVPAADEAESPAAEPARAAPTSD